MNIHNQMLITCLALGLSLSASPAMAAPIMMPEVTSQNLNGEAVTLPTGLPDERTLLIMAFQRVQQENVDTWVTGMHLDTSPVPWLELPVIDNPGMLGRWFINSGMRNGIPSAYTRSHVVSLYLDKPAFLAALGIADEDAVYALVVSRAGEVIECVKGDYSPDGAKKLWQALR